MNPSRFSKNYFEDEFPKLQKLVNRNGQQPCVILTVEDGQRLELRDFSLTSTRLVVENQFGQYSIPFHSIRSIQFVPQNHKRLALSATR
jgi:hypothetical protein